MIVPITASNTLDRARRVDPGAFRTTVDGQSVVQVGLFRERSRADEIYRDLIARRPTGQNS